jgi:hypothetical protein
MSARRILKPNQHVHVQLDIEISYDPKLLLKIYQAL